MSYYRRNGTAVVLELHVQPGVSRTSVAGFHDGRLKVRLAAPPVDGRANEALIDFLADELGVSKKSVRIDAGATARRKRVTIEGFTGELPWKMPSG